MGSRSEKREVSGAWVVREDLLDEVDHAGAKVSSSRNSPRESSGPRLPLALHWLYSPDRGTGAARVSRTPLPAAATASQGVRD